MSLLAIVYLLASMSLASIGLIQLDHPPEQTWEMCAILSPQEKPMRNPKGVRTHKCAPKEWRRTPAVTGDYDLDASLSRNSNRDMAERLAVYTTDDTAYGYRTGYDGYGGYHKDD